MKVLFRCSRGFLSVGTCLSCSQQKSVGAPIEVLSYWTSPVDVLLQGLLPLVTDRPIPRILGSPLQVLGSFPPPGTALTSSGESFPASLSHWGCFQGFSAKSHLLVHLANAAASSEDVVETLGSLGPEGSRADGGEVSRHKCVGWELEKLLGVGCPSSPSQDRAAEQLRGF